MDKNIELIATYDRDSKRYHRYFIDQGQGVTGTIYFPKSEDVPKKITVRLRVKEIVSNIEPD